MPKIERMTIVFPEPMASDIRAAVERGDYASTSEVVRDAVRLWRTRQEIQEHDLNLVREAWAKGKASGVAGPYDMEAILRGARASASKVAKRPRG